MQLQIFTDGGSRGNPGHSAIGGVVFELQKEMNEKKEIHSFSEYLGIGTNNEAEYTAVFRSLEWLQAFSKTNKITAVTWCLDSQLVVNQLNKQWKIKEPRMAALAAACWNLLSELSLQSNFTYVPREQNKQADALVNQALDIHLS